MSFLFLEKNLTVPNETESVHWQDHARNLCCNPAMIGVAHWFAESFLGHQRLAPRAASIFTTQQKWLLAHLAASLYFRAARKDGEPLTLQNYVREAVQHRVASRNTARDFFLELVKYNFSASESHFNEIISSTVAEVSVHPTQETMVNMRIWYEMHLYGLDMLDGGNRTATFSRNALGYISAMEPFIAEAFLICPDIRTPGPGYALFSWVDEGGLLMDGFISGIDQAADLSAETIPLDVVSVAELARGLNLSRVHAARVINRAIDIGALGWLGARGHSRMWMSRAFHEEYVYFQALKMAILDAAFSAASTLPIPSDKSS